MFNEVKIKCRKCGRLGDSGQFVLDPDYKMVVCPMCVKDKKSSMNYGRSGPISEDNDSSSENTAPAQKPQSAQSSLGPEKKSDELFSTQSSSKIKLTCSKCQYTFKYDVDRKFPPRCPYCSSPVNHVDD